MKKKIIAVGVIVAAVIAVMVVPRFFKKKEFAQPVTPPVLSASYPEIGDIRLSTDLIGTVEPSESVYIYPKAAGDITAVHIKPGDVVTEGQILCEIDTKMVDTAKNSMDSAALSLSEAQSTLNRMQPLYQGGTISAQSYEEYQNSVNQAQLNYNAAKINYENQLEYSTVKAPISGVVESSDMEVHDTVSTGNRICVISGQGNKMITFHVTERIKKYLSAGDPITVKKDGEEYSGSITEIESMADASTGLFKVKADVENNENLSTGTTLQLSVVSEKAENALTIPVNAVYFNTNEAYVYTYEDGIVHKKEVETGIFDSEKIEIQSGLTADDLVVTTWSSELYEGAQVTLKTDVTDQSAQQQEE